jgi:hypothetical protein
MGNLIDYPRNGQRKPKYNVTTHLFQINLAAERTTNDNKVIDKVVYALS